MRNPLLGFSILALTCAPNAQTWVQKELIGPRENRSVTYDPVRDRAVLFGGQESDFRLLGDTWEWDGVGWSMRLPVTSPSPRGGHATGWDAGSQQVLLFGGWDGSQVLADTWAWDGVEWTQLAPATTPTAAQNHSMIWDPVRGELVMLNGSETWIWDGADWDQTVTVSAPSYFNAFAMAWDGINGGILAHGDSSSGSDTWLWNGVDWIDQGPVTTPSTRIAHAMVWDPVGNRVVMFGGASDPSSYASNYNSTWAWSGADWALLSPTASPERRDYQAMWCDTAENAIMLFGGVERSRDLYFSDVWRWTGVDWSRNSAASSPQGTDAGSMAFDSARGVSVLVDGSASGPYSNGETWTWDGEAWLRYATGPQLRRGAAMVFDSARAKTVLFGGFANAFSYFGDTWEWDGAAWALHTPAMSPPARATHAMAYDSARGVAVLFGGSPSGPAPQFGDTWEWDGTSWTQRTPVSAPAPRCCHSMAYDATRGVVVLFGGFDFSGRLDDHWEWDGAIWTQRTPTTTPPARSNASMAWDSVTERVVLFGGRDGSLQRLGDMWSWDGSNWIALSPPDSPSPRLASAMAYDSDRGRLVIFSGSVDSPFGSYVPETWEYGTTTPSETSEIGQACAGLKTPQLRAFGLPTLGNASFGLDLTRAAGSASALFALAASTQPAAIGPCTWYLGAPVIGIADVTTATGFAFQAVPIPADPVFAGGTLYAQAVTLDASAPLGASLTSAIQMTVGE